MAAADAIAKALGGRKAGSGWIARCPAHDDRNPSLSLSTGKDGKVLLRCLAGCDQAQVIDALRARGLWEHRGRYCSMPRAAKVDHPKNAPSERDDTDRTEYALRIWRAAVPALNTLAETYLQSRGLRLPLTFTLRFHGGLEAPFGRHMARHGSACLPRPERCAAGRTPHVSGSRRRLARPRSDPAKMMLGPCRGGAVRLSQPGDMLMVGEGIETCLAAMQATSHPAWAALSTSGLRALDLPESVREVIVLADGDDPGEAAARDCALRWQREGRRVRIARPPRGQDFNDVLIGHAHPETGRGGNDNRQCPAKPIPRIQLQAKWRTAMKTR